MWKRNLWLDMGIVMLGYMGLMFLLVSMIGCGTEDVRNYDCLEQTHAAP